MYSSSGGVANGGRIYNPRPDPAEVGPPRRVNREESHVGEMVASSKRRISWTFTLGDSENIHEVVLVHSILSYKKVIEFDGRQMHFSSTATPGDWSYTMFLDNTKYAIEVRINDLDSADVPKYDLVIDRVPFRRWDVFRRRKQVNAPAGSVFGRSSFQQQAPTQTGGGDTFGKHKWGPSGMTAPAPMEPSPPSYGQRHSGSFSRSDVPNGQRNSGSFSRSDLPNTQRNSGSFSRDDVPITQRNSGSFSRSDVPNVTYQSPSTSQGLYNGGTSQPSQAHYNGAASQRQPSQMKTTQAASTQRRKSIHDEIDLLGDFGSSDLTTVTAQQLIFDPLAGSKLGAGQQSTRTASQPSMPAVTPPQANARTASNPQLAQQQPAQPYVDPFATVAQPLPIKPGASSFNLDPLANQNSMYMQQQSRPATTGMPSYPIYQPQGGIPRGMPMQQQPMQGGYPTPVTGMPAANGGYQPPKIGGGNSGGANYNISHLMNPMEVNSLRNAQQTKSINIDPFAGMHTK